MAWGHVHNMVPPACLARNKMNLMLCSIDKKKGLDIEFTSHCIVWNPFFPLYEISMEAGERRRPRKRRFEYNRNICLALIFLS